jgi:transcription-repair coupling factor (superfamily II helicase)
MSQARWYEYLKNNPKNRPEILLCEDAKEASELSDVSTFLEVSHIVLPDFRATYMDDLRPFSEELFALFAALAYLLHGIQKTVDYFTSKNITVSRSPDPSLLQSETIEFASSIDLGAFKEKLIHWGYTFVDMVEMEGEVSHRGDILDIYVPNQSNPYRISLV